MTLNKKNPTEIMIDNVLKTHKIDELISPKIIVKIPEESINEQDITMNINNETHKTFEDMNKSFDHQFVHINLKVCESPE